MASAPMRDVSVMVEMRPRKPPMRLSRFIRADKPRQTAAWRSCRQKIGGMKLVPLVLEIFP